MNAFLVLLLLAMPASQEGVTISGKITTKEGAKIRRKMRVVRKYVGPGIEHHKDPDPSPAIVYLEGVPPQPSVKEKVVDVRQKGLEFRPRILVVQRGTTVRFPNNDPVVHHVFGLSGGYRIDFPRYGPGESKTQEFPKKGLVKLHCEIHKFMRVYIHILDHPYHTIAGPDGSYSIPNVPPGRYTLVVWKEFYDYDRREIEVKAEGLKADFRLSHARPAPAGGAGAR